MTKLLKDNKELLKQWDFEKNGDIDINTITIGSGKKVWWKCKKGHSYTMTVNNKAIKQFNCPICSNRIVLAGFNDLKTRFPNISKEWNYEKNIGLKPENVVYGSNKKVWWRCSKCGYEWLAPISSRTVTGNKCRNCAINSVGKKVASSKLVSNGPITKTHPFLVKEWNYEKNGDLKPEQFHSGSTQKVWWKCPMGHEYQKVIYERAKDNCNCPVCSKESKSSFPEQVIYYYCKKYYEKYNVTNRFKIEKNEADIFIEELKIAIEYDGFYFHNNKKTKKTETKKNAFFKKNGIKLIRMKESAINDLYDENGFDIISINKDPDYNDINVAINKLLKRINEITGKHIKYSINVEKDRIEIMNSYIYNMKQNSLSVVKPELAKEWNYEKNGNLTPNMFTYSSAKIVWWKCDKGHEWEDSINNRTRGNGCLICSNRKVMFGVNDLYSSYPDIIKEWDYKKNTLNPKMVTYASTKKAWWKCDKGHEYELTIYDRTINKRNCPYCSNSKLLMGFNDLKTKYPNIASEWNYEKNGDTRPEEIKYNNNGSFWWKCNECGHVWKTSLYYRINGIGCPKCGIKKQLDSFNANQLERKGSLLDNRPDLAKEWNYEKNNDIEPDNIIATSNKKVWWKCPKGHEWEASIRKRYDGTGCPYCSNRKVLKGFNDLASKYPDLLKEWCYDKNDNLKPDEIVYGSYKKAWWKCNNCGYEWETIVALRTINGCNCPICSRKKA